MWHAEWEAGTSGVIERRLCGQDRLRCNASSNTIPKAWAGDCNKGSHLALEIVRSVNTIPCDLPYVRLCGLGRAGKLLHSADSTSVQAKLPQSDLCRQEASAASLAPIS